MDWEITLKSIGIYLLKVVIVALLILLAFVVGAMIGYSLIGDGENPTDIFNPELWKYILNFGVE